MKRSENIFSTEDLHRLSNFLRLKDETTKTKASVLEYVKHGSGLDWCALIKITISSSIQVNRIVEYIMQCVFKSDFTSLQRFWMYLYGRFFSQMNSESLAMAYKLETNVLRYYVQTILDLVYCFKTFGNFMCVLCV